MKRLFFQKSENNEVIYEFDIVVNLSDSNEEYYDIASSKKSKLQKLNGRKPYSDSESFNEADYHAFIVNIQMKFRKYGFVLKNEHFSDRKDLSFYFDAYRTTDDGVDVRCIVSIRVSDHQWSTRKKKVKYRNDYYSKKLLESDFEDIDVVNIVTDGHKTKNYYDSLKVIESRISEILEVYF